MGDPQKADPASIPDYEQFGLEQPGWKNCGAKLLPLAGRSQLLIDNLMDLTHLPFIHFQVAGGDMFLDSEFRSEEKDGVFHLKRLQQSEWTGFYDILYGEDAKFNGSSELYTLTSFFGPELIRTSGPITTKIDGMDEVPKELGSIYFMHGITPETENTAHYWSFTTRNFRIDDTQLDQLLTEMDSHVRGQDVVAIGKVEMRLEQSAAKQRELLAKADGPAIKVRGMIQKMLDAEAKQ